MEELNQVSQVLIVIILFLVAVVIGLLQQNRRKENAIDHLSEIIRTLHRKIVGEPDDTDIRGAPGVKSSGAGHDDQSHCESYYDKNRNK